MRSRHIAMRCALAALLLVFTLATNASVAQAATGHTPAPPTCAPTLIQRATVTLVRLFIDPDADCYGQPLASIDRALADVRASLARAWATVIAAVRAQIRML